MEGDGEAMLKLLAKALGCIFLILTLTVSIAVSETLFYDDFEDGVISDAYAFSGEDLPQTHAGKGEWVEEGGVLSQTSTSQGDECHAVIMDKQYPELITIQAKVRIDSWANGDSARGGLALRVGENTGRGYNFLFHNNQSTIQFLNDQSSWGNTGPYDFEVGKWYWMQFHIDADQVLHGKVWEDGEQEPDDWMLEQDAFGDTRPWEGGYPALNGGTDPHGGSVTVSFDEAEVWDEGGPSAKAVEPAGKLTTTWGMTKSDLK
jgi:hypothetical protein